MTEPIVRVKQGLLKGAVLDNIEGGQYFCFRGVPYAKPPIGELRFKDPESLESWAGIREALVDGQKCTQFDPVIQAFGGEEDCLYLNIATNSLTGRCPVMVNIPGGAFSAGHANSDLYGPDFLLKKDVIVISITSRVGCFGYLNMDDEMAPGNQGLKDIIAALKWINENISQFGGDPENVTLFGFSSGGAAVNCLALSPLTKGLIHKAICQSGSAFAGWAHEDNSKERGFELATRLGMKSSDPREVVSFLRTIPAMQLVKEQEQLNYDSFRPMKMFFVPSTDSKSKNPVLPEPLIELAKKGCDVPTIIGCTKDETLFMVQEFQERHCEYAERNFEKMLSTEMNRKCPADFAKDIKKFYFGNEPITLAQRMRFMEMIGYVYFVNPILQSADVQAKRKKNVPTYVYKFSHKARDSFISSFLPSDCDGVCHGDDIGYIFNLSHILKVGRYETGSTHRLIMEKMTRAWTDFAKTGDPTPRIDDIITSRWLPVTTTTNNSIEINNDFIPRVDLEKDSWNLWKRILSSED